MLPKASGRPRKARVLRGWERPQQTSINRDADPLLVCAPALLTCR